MMNFHVSEFRNVIAAQHSYEVFLEYNKIINSRHVFWLINDIFVMICLRKYLCLVIKYL